MAVLQQLFGTPPLPAHKVSEETTTIGRQEDCEVMVESPAVSRHHARISFDANRYFIEDLNSRNGTLVNGKAITQRTLLNDGDQIEICTLPFTFLIQSSLTELSGSWGVKPNVISISQMGSDQGDSVRRQLVEPGDRIRDDQLGTDSIRESQVVARIRVADSGAGWPVTRSAEEKLNNVLRLLHILRTFLDRESLISQTLECLFAVFPSCERISVVLRHDSGDGIQVVAAAGREETEEIEVCLPVVRTAMQTTEAILYVDQLRLDEGAEANLENASLRSILVTPLAGTMADSIGAIQLDSNNRYSPLNQDDLEKLVVLAHVISCALEKSLAVEKHVTAELKARSILNARNLRARMSPSAFPDVVGYRVGHRLIASPDVAADLIDYTKLPGGRVACVLIDVPGRGADAAGLMALLSRLIIEALGETGSATQAMMAAEDQLHIRMNSVPMAISVAIMVLDPTRSSVSVAVAGHCPILMIHQGSLKEPDIATFTAPPLGTDRNAYRESELQLYDDDVLLVFSDGVKTIASPGGDILTREELCRMTEQAAAVHRSVFDKKLGDLLSGFHGDAPVNDDVAFVMIHRTRGADTIDNALVSRIESETIAQ